MNFPNLRKLRFQQQIVLPTGIAIFALLSLLLVGAHNYLDWRESTQTSITAAQVGSVWNNLRDENQHLLEWFGREVLADPALERALERGDRQALLALARPRYQKLHAEFGISHWYFITPDKRVLLRVHDPALAGDEIRRKTLLAAERSGSPSTGLELGMTGTLTLRHVMPWYKGDVFIGYLELGTEVEWFARRIKELLSLDVVGVVHKRYTTEQAFAAGKQNFGFPGQWSDQPDVAVVSQTLVTLPSALADPWRVLAAGGNPGVFEARDTDHIWSGAFLLLPDMAGRPVASLAILRDVGWERVARDRQLLIAGLGCAVLAGLLLLALSTRTRHIEGRLVAAYVAVRETEQRFEHFASATSDWWFWEMDADLRFSYFSPNAASSIGRPIDSMLGRQRRDLISQAEAGEQDKWGHHLDDLENWRPFLQFEYRIALPDGSERWLSISGVPIHDGSGAFLGYRGTGTNITERKRTEESLHEQQELSGAIVAQAADGMGLLEPDSLRLLDFNDAACRGLGYTREEFKTLSLADVQAQMTGSEMLAAVAEIRERGEADFETLHKRKDGSLRNVLVSARMIRFRGRPYISLVWHDMTERRRARQALVDSEQRLRASEERYRLLLQHSPLGILHYDQNLLITYCNTRFAEIVHAPVERLQGMDMNKLLDARPLPAFRAALSGEEAHYEGAYRTTITREDIWVSLASAPFVDGTGKISGGIGIVEDITVRRLNERELERHRHHLEDMVTERTRALEAAESNIRLVLESSADGLYGLDMAGRVSFINPAACRMLGYTAAQMEGQSFHDLVHHTRASGEHCPVDECPVHIALRQGCPIAVSDDVYWHADGRRIPVIYSSHPMFREGQVVGAVVSFMDITERQALEDAREAARAEAVRLARVRSDFLANMSHEIRTPLNGVLGMARIGHRDSQGRAARETFARILESGKLLLGVINDILDFSKIDSGKLKVESVPVDLGRILAQSLELMAERARAKGIALHLVRAADLPLSCLSDSLRLTQVLMNLLSNAVKFTEHGTVSLEAAREGDTLLLRVRDTGIGMSAEQVSRLFRPFEQADTSITRRFGGTGLGLSISKHILNLMGGELRVHSRVGEGSCFEVRLPLVACVGEVEGADDTPLPTGPRLAGLSILAAEDNEVNQMVLEELLSEEGVHLVLAANGREAVDLLVSRGRDAFDIVLMDIQMPVMDGFEATRHILALAPDLPVVGLTAHTMAEERDKCLAAGMVAHVAKPIDLDELVAVIRHHARAKR